MTEDFISTRNIRNYKKYNQIIIRKGMIITPSAKDIARELGIKIIHEHDIYDGQNENIKKTGDLNPVILGNGSVDSGLLQDMTLEILEGNIERIVKETLSSKYIHTTGKIHEGHSKQFVLMLNFSENREIEREVISFLLDMDFTIKHLHTFSSTGIQFIILILESHLTHSNCESSIDSLKDKFPVNVLLS